MYLLDLSRSSLILDLVFIALIPVLPVLFYSIAHVRKNKQYHYHKKIQVGLSVFLLIVILLFEVDVRIFGWEQYAKQSPYYHSILFPFLYVHLVFAIGTFVLWSGTLVLALKNFSRVPYPNEYSSKHKVLARASALGLTLSIFSGWVFFYLAFVAT